MVGYYRYPDSPAVLPHAEPQRQQVVSAAGHGPPPTDTPPQHDDVLFYVGKRRQPYHVNAESLIRGSDHFRSLLRAPFWPNSSYPFVLDCEEGVFQNMILLMRYGTFDALPPMSPAETFQLKKEADRYGITYAEPCDAGPRQSAACGDTGSDISSSASGSPKSAVCTSPPATPHGKRTSGHHHHHHEGVRLAGTTPRRGLADLPEFPLDLADPARLVLVSCVEADGKAKFYRCECASDGGTATQWALSFHHRHAFCTACGTTPKMPAKHFADMFMAAAAHYSAERGGGAQQPLRAKWRVSSDSTCLLRFVSSAEDRSDACECLVEEEGVPTSATIWAVSSFYSHAFCTRCREAADGSALLSLLLTLRYGGGGRTGGNKLSKSARSAFSSPPPTICSS